MAGSIEAVGVVVVAAHGSGAGAPSVVGGSVGAAAVVVVAGLVSGDVVVVTGTVVAVVVVDEQSATRGDDSAAGFADAAGVDVAVAVDVWVDVWVDAEGTELELDALELVWPSIRCSTVSVDDNCTVPSIFSVVVRSPRVTAAVLKIEGAGDG